MRSDGKREAVEIQCWQPRPDNASALAALAACRLLFPAFSRPRDDGRHDAHHPDANAVPHGPPRGRRPRGRCWTRRRPLSRSGWGRSRRGGRIWSRLWRNRRGHAAAAAAAGRGGGRRGRQRLGLGQRRPRRRRPRRGVVWQRPRDHLGQRRRRGRRRGRRRQHRWHVVGVGHRQWRMIANVTRVPCRSPDFWSHTLATIIVVRVLLQDEYSALYLNACTF
mmetsp:Transcript_26456/g.78553  ORF Transcript_26456/g.78553 Transcript_26456/m.78553 type:complete len:221 (-) Transcript_26456:1710-2372(-)